MKNNKGGTTSENFKRKALEWMKNNPTQAKVAAVAVLVVLFCIIFIAFKGSDQPEAETARKTVTLPIPTPESIPEPDPIPETKEESLPDSHKVILPGNIELKLVKIKAGEFVMGSPVSEKGRSKAEDQARVTIDKDFYIGVFEVTQEQYAAVMNNNPSGFKGKKLPVETISWDQAIMFCETLNANGRAMAGWRFTLPTSRQWEYACRAGSETVFSWGNSLNGQEANCAGTHPYRAQRGTYLRKTVAVGSYAPNAWGLYDMHGNVWEWCSDFVSGKDKRGRIIRYREIRGGAWGTPASSCRSANRGRLSQGRASKALGFRVAMVSAD